MEPKRRIALGMSGGVDSATTAVLLLRAGYDVVGVTCLFLDSAASHAAARDAAEVCAQLGIAHVIKDCTAEFERSVVSPFVRDYSEGVTPSPCVFCNALCKIPLLMQVADELGCEKVATGHYARIAQLSENNRYVVKSALDVSKDQSYMLSQLTQDQLARLVLPLGAVTKAEIRIMARDIGLPVADKPESQDICFIEGDYVDFLGSKGIVDKPGHIVTEAGTVVGEHRGLFRYTIGQRKGIGVSAPEPYYVIGKRIASNELVVGFRSDAFITEVVAGPLNWQAFERLEQRLECMVKLRYRSRSVACAIEPCGGVEAGASFSAWGSEGDLAAVPDQAFPCISGNAGCLQTPSRVEAAIRVRLRSPQPTTAPGQFAVFYEGETVLGGGSILSVS